jgi:arylamine N-acetyltransferase
MRFQPLDRALAARILQHWKIADLPDHPSRRLDVLHAACLRRVPFENLTKLVHRRLAPSIEAARREAPIFWDEHLAMGTGGTCFSTTEGFGRLLAAMDLDVRPIFCHLPAERRHAHVALIVETEAGPRLCDTGYALAAPMPLPGRLGVKRKTRHYDMELRPGVDGEHLLFIDDFRGRRFRYQFRDADVSPEDWYGAWDNSLAPAAVYMNRLSLGRFGFAVRWILHPDNRVMVLSRRGERAIALSNDETLANRRLSRLFQVPELMLASAREALRERLAAAPGVAAARV